MKPLAYVFPITAIVIFIQAITGAITVLDFYDVGTHMTTGYIVGALVVASAAVAFASKPKYNALRYSSLVLLALVVAQGMLGFSAETSDQLVAVHFTNSLLLFGVSLASIFYAFRWGQITIAPPMQTKQ